MTTTIEQNGLIEYTRGRDFFDPGDHPNLRAVIVGCGGIGSFTAHALAKLGVPNMTLVDFDRVEPHNIPNQLYGVEDIGLNKAEALAAQLDATTNANISWWGGRVTEDGFEPEDYEVDPAPQMSGIVVSALDNMSARQMLWDQVKMRYPVNLFIDGRLGGQNIVVYTVKPCDLDDIEGYEATLHSDTEGLDLPCTGRNVIDVGYAMASLITRHVRTHAAGEDLPKITYQDQESLSLMKSGWLL